MFGCAFWQADIKKSILFPASILRHKNSHRNALFHPALRWGFL
jgi:hypothetical protein